MKKKHYQTNEQQKELIHKMTQFLGSYFSVFFLELDLQKTKQMVKDLQLVSFNN